MHNYHHTFPWDYTTSDQKWYESYNVATLFIVIASKLGLAYDLKKPSKDIIQQYVEKNGDIIEVNKIHDKSLFTRLITGLFDWILGSLVTSWPLWTIGLFKIALQKPIKNFDLNDFIFLNN